jgi:mevalonate kinase
MEADLTKEEYEKFIKWLESPKSDSEVMKQIREMVRKLKIKSASNQINEEYKETFQALSKQDMKESMDFKRRSWERDE